ncbi:MAG TPA: hypothetical protein PKK12_12140 [Candidatus Aminicenantes bacterium]|nr:hypothetical protein [Candidatus Aminicenantes bacterium]
MKSSDEILQAIRELIRDADNRSDLEFRMELERIATDGGNPARKEIIQTITASTTPQRTRFNLIRVASYLRSPSFITPLQQLIDTDPDVNIKIAAIICIAKYNDKRAVEVLQHALDRVTNPGLQTLLNAEINKIRQNNPLVALMPKFNRGSHNREIFAIVVKVFTKILTPADTKVFIPYLRHADPLVVQGAFQILCQRGDETVLYFVLDACKSGIRGMTGMPPPETTVLYFLDQFTVYARRIPQIIEPAGSFLTELANHAAPAVAARARELLSREVQRSSD